MTFKIRYGKFTTHTDVLVIEGLVRPILSVQVLKALHLIPAEFPFEQLSAAETGKPELTPKKFGFGPELDSIMNRYPEVFDGKVTTMNGEPHHIELEDNAVPVNTGCSRMISEPYMNALKKELDSQVDEGIIEKVEGATEWLHPIVVVP
ncbi:MAG: hypothetical protein ACOYB2_19955, partial [Limnohabitans sp.]